MTKQYIQLIDQILTQGANVMNERTGKICRTLLNVDLTYDASTGLCPVITTRKAPWKTAIAELLGYLKGYSNAADFRQLGAKTWDANANQNEAWLANPHRKGTDDMGLVYGAVARGWPTPECLTIDTLSDLVTRMKQGDDRGLILTFWNPGVFDRGCLRPCMHTHTFSILKGVLHLTSYQRSCDVPLGLVANMIQCVTLLRLMAQISGLQPGKVWHKIVNAHIYEDQIQACKALLERTPHSEPTLCINPRIATLQDITDWVTVDDFSLLNYRHHDPIAIPFSV